MIANAYLNEWRQTVPWSDNKMVEQDLIISRLLVELFNHPKISDSLAFRGGTAIYKLFASHPVRYSEDIDLVQIKAEPIGDTVTAIRSIVDPMLGEPERKRSKKTFTLTYDILAEGESVPQKLKIEINMAKIILSTERLILRTWEPSDVPLMTAISSDLLVMEHFPAIQVKRHVLYRLTRNSYITTLKNSG